MQDTMSREAVVAEVSHEKVELAEAPDSAVDSVICSPRLLFSEVVSSTVAIPSTPELLRAANTAENLSEDGVRPLAKQDFSVQLPSPVTTPSPAGDVVETEDADGFKHVSRKKIPKKRANPTHSAEDKDAEKVDAPAGETKTEVSEAQKEAPEKKEKKEKLGKPKAVKPVNPFQGLEDEGEQLPEAEDEVRAAHKRKNRGKNRKVKKVALQSPPEVEAVTLASEAPAPPPAEETSSHTPQKLSSPALDAEAVVRSTPAAVLPGALKAAPATAARIRLAVCGTCIAAAGGMLMWQVSLL